MSHLSVGEEPVAQNFAIGPNPRDFALGSFSSQTDPSLLDIFLICVMIQDTNNIYMSCKNTRRLKNKSKNLQSVDY